MLLTAVVSLGTGLGVSQVVNNIVAATMPAAPTIAEKVLARVGAVAIGGAAGVMCSNYMVTVVDGVKTLVQKTVEQTKVLETLKKVAE